MIKPRIKWGIAFACLQLSSCVVGPPSSVHPGQYSSTTGLPLYPSKRLSHEQVDATLLQSNGVPIPNTAPFPDDKAVKFTANSKHCQDIAHVPDLRKVGDIWAPGVVVFSLTGLTIDEAEITNLEWRLFVADAFSGDSSSANSVAAITPDANALPVRDYYTSPFYAYYPVVGISYEQAVLYCKWRTEAVNRELAARSSDKRLAGLSCEYRLPTEAEWEEAAEVSSGKPYGTTCLQLPVRVAEGAAAYLKKRADTSTPIAQIKADIAAYNKQQPSRSWVNYAQAEPYFLRLATPGYVFQGPPNNFGLYQMLGNAAEMVQERGVTKGGSYRDELAACRIKARGKFTGPSPLVGFRAVCVMHRAEPVTK